MSVLNIRFRDLDKWRPILQLWNNKCVHYALRMSRTTPFTYNLFLY